MSIQNSVHHLLPSLTKSVRKLILHVCVHGSPQCASSTLGMCFNSFVQHRQPVDAHILMSNEPQFSSTNTSCISVTVYLPIIYRIGTHSVYLMFGCVRLCMCLSVCIYDRTHTGWSLCVVSPNWGSDTAVLSLAFPSFPPLSAS